MKGLLELRPRYVLIDALRDNRHSLYDVRVLFTSDLAEDLTFGGLDSGPDGVD